MGFFTVAGIFMTRHLFYKHLDKLKTVWRSPIQYLNVYYLCCFSYLKYPNEWWQPSWGNIVALMSLFILDIWNSLGEVSQMGETEKEEEVWEKPSNRYVIEEFTQNGGEFRFGLIQTEQNKGLSLHIVPMLCAIGILLLDWRGRERLFVFIKQTVWSSCIVYENW